MREILEEIEYQATKLANTCFHLNQIEEPAKIENIETVNKIVSLTQIIEQLGRDLEKIK